MRRRSLAFIATSIAALGVWSACSDYDDAIVFPENDAATSSSSGGVEAAASTDAGPSDATVADVIEDRRVIEIEIDDASAIDAASCTDQCDCDGDGYLAPVCADAAAVDKDCDDHDSRRHPGSNFRVDPTDNGDWDCSTTLEKAFAENMKCSSFTSNCDTRQGFSAANVPCGQDGDFLTCHPPAGLGLTCVNGTIEKRPQACR